MALFREIVCEIPLFLPQAEELKETFRLVIFQLA